MQNLKTGIFLSPPLNGHTLVAMHALRFGDAPKTVKELEFFIGDRSTITAEATLQQDVGI